MDQIKYIFESINIREIEESPINAQVMSESDFNRLVKNLKKDKVLTSSVLLMKQKDKSKLMCISGHHRIKAAKKAGIKEIPSLIIDEVEESTRIRLQLTHNDIHGYPDESIVSIMQSKLQSDDIELINYIDSIDNSAIEEYKLDTIEMFQYISICLKPSSYEELIQLIGSHSVEAETKMLIEHEDYNEMKKALTLAFKEGFKTPGRAFRKFLDIVNNHTDELNE